MKKLFLITAILLVTLSGFSQRSSVDVLKDLSAKVGKNVLIVDKEIMSMIDQYLTLSLKELRIKPNANALTFEQIVPNLVQQFCLTCRCGNDGYWDAQHCGFHIPSCGFCPACHSILVMYIQACSGSPCQQF